MMAPMVRALGSQLDDELGSSVQIRSGRWRGCSGRQHSSAAFVAMARRYV
jgi:hypothetical protein